MTNNKRGFLTNSTRSLSRLFFFTATQFNNRRLTERGPAAETAMHGPRAPPPARKIVGHRRAGIVFHAGERADECPRPRGAMSGVTGDGEEQMHA